MDTKTPGLRRYLYEYLFYNAVEKTKENTGRPILVSAAKKLRADVERHLRAEGLSMSDPRLQITPVLRAIDTAMSQGVEGYQEVYKGHSSQSEAYQEAFRDFTFMAGIGGNRAYYNDPLGKRLVVSPYDPRWSGRSTVKRAGSQLVYIAANDVDSLGRGEAVNMHRINHNDFKLWAVRDNNKPYELGRAVTLDDRSGLSELMSRMTRKEYDQVRDWVLQPYYQSRDITQFMTRDALARSVAILDYMRDNGIDYTISRDRSPGQIAAHITGTKIMVRLMDTRENENYVGRTYDDGMAVYYSTNAREKAGNTFRFKQYEPTAKQSVDLLKLALGQQINDFNGHIAGKVNSEKRIVPYHNERQWNRQTRSYDTLEVPNSYYNADQRTHMIYMGETDGGQIFVRRSAKDRSAASRYFEIEPVEGAERYLNECVDSARENFRRTLDAERLIVEAQEHQGEEDYVPEFSGNTEIAAIQRSYWDVLSGKTDKLLRPGANIDDYNDSVAVLAELDLGVEQREITHDMLAKDYAYVGSGPEQVRAHMNDIVDDMIGTYDLHEVTLDNGEVGNYRFDPGRVANYMESDKGAWANTANLVSAMRRVKLSPEELMGEGYSARNIKEQLVEFDITSAKHAANLEDGVQKRMMGVVLDSLDRGGVIANDVLIDDNGIIRWEGHKLSRDGKLSEKISGYVGQVFEQGDSGEIITKFASGDNNMIIPGYEARIVAQKPGENLSVEQRTVLRGYEQLMADQIRYQVANDLMVMRGHVGTPTSINNVYRRLYEERRPVDFLTKAEERGFGRGWAEAVVKTLAGKVRYPDEMAETFHESWRAEKYDSFDASDDNFDSPFVKSGGRNMSVISEDARGYFDPDMTNGSKMGTTFYLGEGVKVDPESGRMIRSDNLDARAPIMNHEDAAFMKYNAWDRRQMISSMLLHATSVTEPQRVAMTDVLKGWTADDGRVVSKAYAEAHPVMKKDGTTRPLIAGDKDSDFHGNKGVIGLVVDPDMDLDEAREQGIEDAVLLFRKNPGLSVVMSPFSAVSRFNGGTAREMMQDSSNLVLPDDTVVPGGQGSLRFIITNKDVESGTRVYDEEAIAQGGGRRASAQLSWALSSFGADKVLGEFYGPNSSAMANMREYLIVSGLDVDGFGQLRMADEQTHKDRRFVQMPEIVLTKKGSIHRAEMRKIFANNFSDRGGDMEMPFPLTMSTGEEIPASDHGTWRLPVLSSHLRSGQELDDGSSVAHDYTNQYLAIYEEANRYRHAQDRLNNPDLTKEQRTRLEKHLVDAKIKAQTAFDYISSTIRQRQFSGKHNIFKEGLMTSRLPFSGTAVWTADPRLDIDTIGMGPDLAEGLGVKDGDQVLIWRDPILRDGGVRYQKVHVDERLTGISANPVIAQSFDGDFDGDSFAVVKLTSAAGKRQADELCSMKANLLDLSHKEDIEVNGDVMELYPLYFHNALDTKVSEHFDPSLKKRFAELTLKANELHSDKEEGEISIKEALERGQEIVDELSEFYRDAHSSKQKGVALRFDTPQSHYESVREACIDTGAKGSPKKLESYGQYFGLDTNNGVDLKEPQNTRKDDENVMVAVTVKTMVGIAGAYTHRFVKALHNDDIKAALEASYPNTQSLLQSKHSADEAIHKADLLLDSVRAHCRGRSLMRQGNEWVLSRDDKGRPMQATREEWVEQFMDIYNDPEGLNVKIDRDYAERMADQLSDPKTGVMIDMEAPGALAKIGKGSILDSLAYGGTFEDVKVAAQNKMQLFDGQHTQCFAPYDVRRNFREVENYQRNMERRADPTRGVPEPQISQPVVRDVLSETHDLASARGQNRRSNIARTVRVPGVRHVPEFHAAQNVNSAPDNDSYEL